MLVPKKFINQEKFGFAGSILRFRLDKFLAGVPCHYRQKILFPEANMAEIKTGWRYRSPPRSRKYFLPWRTHRNYNDCGNFRDDFRMIIYIHHERSAVCGGLSNQVQRLFKIHFIRCSPLQTFARAVVQCPHRFLNIFIRILRNILMFRAIFP